MADDHSSWVARDAAVVWHGFTQMSAYADNAPIVVDSAEGRELDRRRGSSLPRRHLVTLGDHPGPPGARARRGPPGPARPGGPLDDAGQRQPGRDRAGRGAGRPGAGRRSPLPVRQRRRGGGRAGPQDRVPALDEPRRRGPRPLPRLQRRVPRRHDRLAVRRRRRVRHRRVRPAPVPRRARALRRPGRRRRRPDRGARRRPGRGRGRAARAGRGGHGGAARRSSSPALAEACRRHDVLLICDEVATGFGRTGTLFAVDQCGVRPDLLCLGKGITGGYLPLSATVASGRGVRRVPRPRPVRAHALPRALLQRERAGRGRGAAPPAALRRVGRARQRRGPGPSSWPALLDEQVAPLAGGGRGAPAGPDGRHRAGPAPGRAALGSTGVGRRASSAAC